MHPDERETVSLGPARLELTPADPLARSVRAGEHPGPASLCLALLAGAGVTWEGVSDGGGGAAEPVRANLAALPAAALPALLAALLPPETTPREAAELAELEALAAALADYPGLDCAACRESAARGEGAPDCAACPRPPLPGHARPVLELYRWLADLPPGGEALAARAWSGLGPRRARDLARRLAALHRVLTRGRAGQEDLGRARIAHPRRPL